MNKKTYIAPEVKQTLLMPEQPMFENKSIKVDNGGSGGGSGGSSGGGVDDTDDDFEMTRPFYFEWTDTLSNK